MIDMETYQPDLLPNCDSDLYEQVELQPIPINPHMAFDHTDTSIILRYRVTDDVPSEMVTPTTSGCKNQAS